ncbi:hypothetical protein FDF74_00040 [Clostridium niameyense]|uniref:DUF7033 domain-containing protein n=1 Tax=Clostridium niameyense TaxID=1622073 RepID=A0A6M0R731_9CLOT|nr:polysaccharide deacetylase family protein [Clostridium niameyense]NEZ45597.1 hypothetical protein [Clostridium niameyense]
MINFIPCDKVNKKFIYCFYYLTKEINEDVDISNSPIEGDINIFYGLKPTIKNSIYIPFEEINNAENVFENYYDTEKYITFKPIENPYKNNQNIIEFKFDIISSAAYMICCEEEYKLDKRDDKNRFLSDFSFRRENINRPLFDIYKRILIDSIKNIDNNIQQRDKKLEVLITHDVDNVDSRNIYILLHLIKDNIMKKRFINALKQLVYYSYKNRYNMFEKYLSIEKKYDVISDFYFILGQKGRFGRRYSLDTIKDELQILKNNNNGIGMHTNYYYYNDYEKILTDKNSLEDYIQQDVIGCRNHYLRFNVPDSWEILKNINIKYDTTLGYSDNNGFRAGTCSSFVPFNLNSSSLIPIYEVPLVIMDILVMENSLSYDEKFNKVKNILDYSKEYKGTISILWHLCVLENNDYKKMYLDILEYIKSIGGTFIDKGQVEAKFERELKDINKLFSKLECVK